MAQFLPGGQYGGVDARGTFSWVPSYSDGGTYQVIIRAMTTTTCTRSDTVLINVTEAPVLRVRMPGLDQRVHVVTTDPEFGYFLRESYCFSDGSFNAYVPLGEVLPSGEISWYNLVVIEPQYFNYAAYLASPTDPDGDTWGEGVDVIEPVLGLEPAARPADRLTEYTVPYDPWKMFVLGTFRNIKAIYLEQYGYVPAQVPVRFRNGAESLTGLMGIALTNDCQTIPQPNAASNMAHEYAHWLQLGVTGPAEYQSDECDHPSHPDACNPDFCPRGVWVEGMADGMADLYTHLAWGTTFTFCETCSYNTTCSAGITEANVANYVYAISRARPTAFMHTYRTGRLTSAGESPSHAFTFSEFHGLWQDEDPEPELIAVHAPGAFDDAQILDWFIHHTGLTTRVLESASGIERVRFVGPNPAHTSFTLETKLTGESTPQLKLFDVRGRLVLDRPLSRTGRSDVPIAALPTGVYFVRVLGDRDEILWTRRIVVVR